MLGELSSVYESNGDWGAISSGEDDYGGKSYGAYQLASNPGTVQRYINWLRKEGYWFADNLDQYEIGSYEFDAAWSWLADPAMVTWMTLLNLNMTLSNIPIMIQL